MPRKPPERRGTELVPIDRPDTAAIGPVLSPEEASWLKQVRGEAKAANTVRTYKSQLKQWEAWCKARGATSCPATAESVSLHILWMYDAKKSIATIETRFAAISWLHQEGGFESPTWQHSVLNVLEGLRRRAATEGRLPKPKAPITLAELKLLLLAINRDDCDVWRKIRARALFVLAFAAAFRRSELLGVHVEHLEFVEAERAENNCLVIRIPKSKTNQTGEAESVTVSWGANAETCPIRLLRAWLTYAKVERGPVFAMSPTTFVRAIKRYIKVARIRGGMAAFSGHSFRAGHVTEAKLRGVPNEEIREVTRHTNDSQLDDYDRRAAATKRGSGRKLGL